MKPLDVCALAVPILIWAFAFSVVKIGVAQFPPLLMTAIRFTIVAVLLSPFLRYQKGRMGQIFLLGANLGLHFSLMFTGMKGVDAGPAAIAVQLYVPFSVLLAWVVFRETLGGWQMVGMAVAFLGVYYLSGEPRIAPKPVPFMFLVASAFTMAVATMQIKRLGTISVFTLNAWVALLAMPQLFLASWLIESDHMEMLAAVDWRGWGAVAYIAIAGTITAHGIWYYLIGRYPVNRLVPASLIAPVLAVFVAAWLLDEPLNARTMIGGAITIAGVALLQVYRPPKRRGVAP